MTLSITEDAPTDEAAEGAVAGAGPAAEVATTDDAALIEEDLLVEDVSIDGMCGVY